MAQEMPTDAEIDLNQIVRQYADELDGLSVELTFRNPGDGRRYALRAYPEGETYVVWESPWFPKKEFEAYLRGMKNLRRLFSEGERARKDAETDGGMDEYEAWEASGAYHGDSYRLN